MTTDERPPATSHKSAPRHVGLVAGLSGAVAVALGAFGAHALSGVLPEGRLDTLATANEYHFYHTLALLATLALPYSRRVRWAQVAFGWGHVLFCGSLYLLATRGLLGAESAGWFGAITPLGGVAFIAGWILLALAMWEAGGG